MREGWVEKQLKDVAFVFAGQSAPQKQEDYSLTGTPFIKAGNLSELISGKNEDSILKVTDFAVEKYGLKKYKSGSVLFAKSGMSCLKGYVYVTKNDCYVVSHLAIVQPKEDVNSYYLKYHFMYHKPYLLAKDTAYPSISIADILNYKIILPKIEKQEQIVSELDMITEMISKYDEQLKVLDKLSQSIFYEMFGDPMENEKGWEMSTIEMTCIIKSGNSEANYSKVGTLPYIKVSDMNLPLNSKYINTYSLSVDFEQNKKNIIPIGATIFPKRGGAIFTNKKRITNKEICCDLNIMAVIPGIRIQQEYLYMYFMFIDFSKLPNGSSVPQINNKDIGPLKIALPPLPLQQSFARKIEAIEAMKSKVREAKKEAETLLAARMQYWFE